MSWRREIHRVDLKTAHSPCFIGKILDCTDNKGYLMDKPTSRIICREDRNGPCEPGFPILSEISGYAVQQMRAGVRNMPQRSTIVEEEGPVSHDCDCFGASLGEEAGERLRDSRGPIHQLVLGTASCGPNTYHIKTIRYL